MNMEMSSTVFTDFDKKREKVKTLKC